MKTIRLHPRPICWDKPIRIILLLSALLVLAGFSTPLPSAPASAQGVRWISLDAPVESTALGNTSLAWATAIGTAYPNTFDSAGIIDSGLGPNQVYGSGGVGVASFTGFQMETTPGYTITKVEAILQAYTPVKLKDNLSLSVYLGGQKL